MRRSHLLLVIGASILLVAGAALAVMRDKFLPEGTERLAEDQAAPATVLGEGTWSGKAGHAASGTVKLLRVGDTHVLRFEEFEMTSGPMVYLYLTPSEDADTPEEIDAGVKILIDGGADGGENTKRGTFNQALPADLDVSRFRGVAAWCDDFDVPFGTARLA